MILYTYSLEAEPNEHRWKDTGTPRFFFAELDEVRQAVIELRATKSPRTRTMSLHGVRYASSGLNSPLRRPRTS